jgi:hypothetical protein
MSLAGSAVLAIWNGVTPGAEEEFVAWHLREHIPERVGLPGFLRGRRYVAIDGDPKYFNFYETERIEDLSSSSYLARLDSPTPWTKAVVAHFTATSRTICRVAGSIGIRDGAAIETIRFSSSLRPESVAQNVMRLVVALPRSIAGIVGAHLLRGDDDASRRPTAEKSLRAGPDEIADWILLIEAVDAERLAALRSSALGDSSLAAAGASTGLKRGIYALQYALSASQLGDDRSL